MCSPVLPLASGPTSKCFDERRQALEQARQSTPDVYIPVCKPDGNFAEVQCHIATGYCWCVADDGKPIPGSSVRGMQIKCRSRNGRWRHHLASRAPPRGRCFSTRCFSVAVNEPLCVENRVECCVRICPYMAKFIRQTCRPRSQCVVKVHWNHY